MKWRIVLAGLCLASVLAGRDAEAQSGIEIACEGSPTAAVTVLPEPLSSWGEIRCTIYGHLLTAADGWIWSFPGAFAPVQLPAQMVRRAPEEVGHAAHFMNIEWVELDAARTAWVDAQINGALGTASDAEKTGYAMTLTNQDGGMHTVYFVASRSNGNENVWGLLCDGPECVEKAPFMVLQPAANAE